MTEPPAGRPPVAGAVAYGTHPLQVANLHLPAGAVAPSPCVVLLHGGFWRSGWDRTLMTALAHDLARRGIAAWNVEYRGTGRDGGGWPETLCDVGRAIDHLASIDSVDPARVVTCGHSAGGHLALWASARARLPSGSELPAPGIVPRAAVSLAGVCDLVAAARDGLGRDATQALLGAPPDEQPARYAQASPVALLPFGVPVLLVHGGRDSDVPPEQSRAFARAAAAVGEAVELVELADADHFDVIDPGHAGWQAVLERLPALLGAPSRSRAPDRGAGEEG